MIQTLVDKVKCLCTGRSSKWPTVQREHLRQEPKCQVCGTKKKCAVHHLQPFHLFPDLELETSNLVTLCLDHHLLVGHLMSWKSYNPRCLSDCVDWQRKIKDRPKI